MRKLENTSLICVDCFSYGAAVAAIKKSMEQITFEKVLFLTDIPLKIDGVEVIQIPTISSKREYSEFVIKQLYQHIPTDYFCLIQADGFIIDGSQWDDRYYDYDYIGASWVFDSDRQVGNGGSSFRTKRLHKILAEDTLIDVLHPEDQSICILYKFYLEEKYGIKFAPVDLADKYSYELKCPTAPTFSFHGKFHPPFTPTVVVRRWNAMGDVVACEPVLRYFYDKGYRVVLDTLPQFHLLFLNHYFKVHRKDQVDPRLLSTAKYVNLDMAYESNPKQLHLKSYFEYAGVSEDDCADYITSPKLSVGFPLTKETNLFQKYVVLHTDNRPVEQGRNIEGINWELVVDKINQLGYIAIQVGRDDTATIKNAIKINCTNENFLCYVCGGADLMVGIDSGISNICSAFDVPCIILSGSVDINYIHPNMSNKIWIHNHDSKPCSTPFCWHNEITTNISCAVDKKQPPCTLFKTEQVLNAIDKLLKP